MNTLLGACTAASILFLSSLVTLFTNDPTMEFDQISTAVWMSVGGGAAIAFLKDFQSLTARRFISRATGSKDGGI